MDYQTCVIAVPKLADWHCRIGSVTYRPLQGDEPNRFHRFMQKLAFGFRWERV